MSGLNWFCSTFDKITSFISFCIICLLVTNSLNFSFLEQSLFLINVWNIIFHGLAVFLYMYSNSLSYIFKWEIYFISLVSLYISILLSVKLFNLSLIFRIFNIMHFTVIWGNLFCLGSLTFRILFWGFILFLENPFYIVSLFWSPSAVLCVWKHFSLELFVCLS